MRWTGLNGFLIQRSTLRGLLGHLTSATFFCMTRKKKILYWSHAHNVKFFLCIWPILSSGEQWAAAVQVFIGAFA